MADQLAVLCATIKSFHDKKKNVLESYIPFIEHCLYSNYENDNISQLQEFIISNYKIEIPKNSLITMLNILKTNNYITLKGENIEILKDMKNQNEEYLKVYEKSRRDLNEFISYYKNNFYKQEISDENVLKQINDLIMYSIDFFDILHDIPSGIVFDSKFHELVSYIIYIRDRNDHLYGIFKDIFFGGLLVNLIKNQGKEINILNPLSVYLDTSYLFRILELQNRFLIPLQENYTIL